MIPRGQVSRFDPRFGAPGNPRRGGFRKADLENQLWFLARVFDPDLAQVGFNQPLIREGVGISARQSSYRLSPASVSAVTCYICWIRLFPPRSSLPHALVLPVWGVVITPCLIFESRYPCIYSSIQLAMCRGEIYSVVPIRDLIVSRYGSVMRYSDTSRPGKPV